MKKFYLLIFFFVFVGFTAFSQTKDTPTKAPTKAEITKGVTKAPCSTCPNGKTRTSLPDDFPKYIDTGNPEQDQATFAEAKKRWVEENPEKYQEILRRQKEANQSK